MATSSEADGTLPHEKTRVLHLPVGDYPQLYKEAVVRFLTDKVPEQYRAGVRSVLLTHKDACEFGFESSPQGNLIQSSPYRLPFLNSFLPVHQALVARPRLEAGRQNTPDFMAGFYVDCGLNLYLTHGELKHNVPQARALVTALNKLGIGLDNAKLLPYNILAPAFQPESGLVLVVSEQGKALAKEVIRDTNTFKWDYSPSESGLFGACLSDGGDWGCGDGGLEGSCRYGGVVVESAVGTAKNLADSQARLRANRAAYIAQLNANIQEATSERDALLKQ